MKQVVIFFNMGSNFRQMKSGTHNNDPDGREKAPVVMMIGRKHQCCDPKQLFQEKINNHAFYNVYITHVQ